MQGKKTSDTLARQIQRFLAHKGTLRKAEQRFNLSRHTVIRIKRLQLPPEENTEVSQSST